MQRHTYVGLSDQVLPSSLLSFPLLLWHCLGTILVSTWYYWVEKLVDTMQRHTLVCVTLTRCYLLHCYHSHYFCGIALVLYWCELGTIGWKNSYIL